MVERRTRWYQSLTFRLLTIFWLLILLTAAAAFSVILYLARPPGPEPMSEEFNRSLAPILTHPSSAGLLQPGRLLVGQYRLIAVERDQWEFTPGLSQREIGAAVQVYSHAEPVQIVVGDSLYAGPLESNEGAVVVGRPATASELAAVQESQADRDFLPRLLLLSAIASFIGALILGWWFVRPLKQLRNATRQVASGVAEPSLKRLPRRRDELGELARTLQRTALDLATSRDAQRRLLSDVSHELRSPVGRLQVALDLLETPDLRQNRNYKQLHKDIYRLGMIIDSILWLSRLENGLEKLVKDQVDVQALLRELKDDLDYFYIAQLGEEGWRGRIELPSGQLEPVATDPVLLRMIVENLVRNAFQYGPLDGVVTIHAFADKETFTLQIRDQGPGAPEEKLAKLFEPFYRGDPSRHHGAGVGLGLALCQRAVAILGGQINARNHPDGGLEVSVEFPR